MIDAAARDQIIEALDRLPIAQQRLIVELVEALAKTRSKGVSGRDLRAWLADQEPISEEDAQAMMDAVAERRGDRAWSPG